MTSLPLKSVKLLPNMDAMIGGGVRSGMREDSYKLTLLVEAGLVRVEARKDGKVFLLPLTHCGVLEPAAVTPEPVKK